MTRKNEDASPHEFIIVVEPTVSNKATTVSASHIDVPKKFFAPSDMDWQRVGKRVSTLRYLSAPVDRIMSSLGDMKGIFCRYCQQ